MKSLVCHALRIGALPHCSQDAPDRKPAGWFRAAGGAVGNGGGSNGGRGGRVVATVPVTPGEELFVFVAGAGSIVGTPGFNGGAAGATYGCPKSFAPSCAEGGRGGSSFAEPSAIKFQTWHGWSDATGNGLVIISW